MLFEPQQGTLCHVALIQFRKLILSLGRKRLGEFTAATVPVLDFGASFPLQLVLRPCRLGDDRPCRAGGDIQSQHTCSTS